MTASTGTPRPAAFTALRIVSTLEVLSLATILTNRFTMHSPAITSTGGPAHGLLYISTILLALLLPLPRSAKWLALIPGVGGLLTLWQERRLHNRGPSEPPYPRMPLVSPATLGEADRAVADVVVDGCTAILSATTSIGPLTFTVPTGRITGLIGPNGAGKTTALRMLCGLVAVASGQLDFSLGGTGRQRLQDGRLPTEPGRPRVGVLIDSPGFLPSLSARENLLVLTRLAGWGPQVADRALERVGLSATQDQRASTFSLGMKQRLGLAAALLGEPDLVILDEPTNGLDPRGTAELRDFLHRLAAQGTTVIISSHALDELDLLCDHLVAMDHGQVFFTGTPEQMLSTLPNALECRTSDPTLASSLQQVLSRHGHTAVVNSQGKLQLPQAADLGGRVNELALQAGIILAEIVPVRPSLEDAFLTMTGARTPQHDSAAAPSQGPVVASSLTEEARR